MKHFWFPYTHLKLKYGVAGKSTLLKFVLIKSLFQKETGLNVQFLMEMNVEHHQFFYVFMLKMSGGA